jgi:hypothetical protein
MVWSPSNKRGLKVSAMSEAEFAEWTSAGRPPLLMSAEAQVPWDRWVTRHIRTALAAERKSIKRDFDTLVEEIGALTATVRKDLEREIAKADSLRICGPFDAKAFYSKHEVAMVNGSSFIATKDAPGPCPGNGWRLLASAGSRGKAADETKIHQLEKQIADLRTEVKALRAVVDGDVTNLPDWPKRRETK